jgi:L-ectoine synthase
MFVRTFDEVKAAGRVLSLVGDTIRSARFLTAVDGMGFSYNINWVDGGSAAHLWFKHHNEANYIIADQGRVTDKTSGQVWEFGPGRLYNVGPNDRHIFECLTDEHHISVFCPALTGMESHDADGAYPATGPVPQTKRTMFVKTVEGMREDGLEKVVAGGTARTLRMLLQADETGFTLSDVSLAAGNRNVLWYKHHWETNHILSGKGTVTDLSSGEVWPLEDGTAYNVGPEDRHSMHAETDLHLLSVFCPALAGDEQHDEEGMIPASGPTPPGPLRS